MKYAVTLRRGVSDGSNDSLHVARRPRGKYGDRHVTTWTNIDINDTLDRAFSGWEQKPFEGLRVHYSKAGIEIRHLPPHRNVSEEKVYKEFKTAFLNCLDEIVQQYETPGRASPSHE